MAFYPGQMRAGFCQTTCGFCNGSSGRAPLLWNDTFMAPRIAVLIHRPLFRRLFREEDQRRLERLGEVRYWSGEEPPGEAEAIVLLQGCQVGIASWKSPAPSPALLAACPELKLWEYVAGSVKKFWGPHLPEHGITVATCNEAIADNVAEFVFAELALGLRRVWELSARARKPVLPAAFRPKALFDCTIGVVGASAVGRRVLKLLLPVDCKILLYDPFVDEVDARTLGTERVNDLVELCRRSDAVTLHTPYLPSTRHLLQAKHFAAMGPETVFINTARGACIDEAALVAELAKGRLFAFIDVTDPEPAAADSPLRSLPNVVLTPHIAGNQSFRLGRQAVNDVAAFVAKRQPSNVVTQSMLARIA